MGSVRRNVETFRKPDKCGFGLRLLILKTNAEDQMLKVDRNNRTFRRLDAPTLADAQILERAD